MKREISPLITSWPDLIMVHGLMESGKSTLATYLVEEHGFVRVKFADTLKKMIRLILGRCGISENRIEAYVEGDLKKTPIPELNDRFRPELLLENLPDQVIRELVVLIFQQADLTPIRIAHLMIHQDEPVSELQGVTTTRRLFETLRNDWSRSMLRGQVVTTRRMMQTLGEEWRNLHSPKLWAYISLAKVERLIESGNRAVIDDNRYRFEFEPFAHLLYFRFVVTRGRKHFLPVAANTHQSEIPMPVSWFDAHLCNDDSIQSLRTRAYQYLNVFAVYRNAKRELVTTHSFAA